LVFAISLCLSVGGREDALRSDINPNGARDGGLSAHRNEDAVAA
jgi:hypothetical protein